jgi:L-ascorbate metabolism protein UlaG (beta-lactamase superfamily)
MVITHHGGQCFKVTFGDLTLAFDPISKKSKLAPVRFGADIALVSKNAPDYSGVEEVTYGDKAPFAILGPGEYERAGVTVQGFLTGGFNTIYSVNLEDMTLVHLGALSDKALSQEAREALGEIDILFVPVGGGEVLSAADAHALATSLEPRIIIPMHYDDASLKAFLKEEGSAAEKVEKLTIRKKDAASKEGAIIVITP